MPELNEPELRFLVVCNLNSHLTANMAARVIEATEQWVHDNLQKGRIEQLWGFAGQPAGGGIIRTESFEELEAIMARFPPGPFCHTKIYALHDIRQLATQAKQVIRMGGENPCLGLVNRPGFPGDSNL